MCANLPQIMKLLALFCIIHVGVVEGCGRSRVTLTNNEYKNLVIAIRDSVPENTELIERIKSIFTTSSDFLFNVTRRRAVFREISILVPPTWSDKSEYEVPSFENQDTADVVVDSRDQESGNTPFTIKASSTCGDPGKFISLTSEYLLNDDVASSYGAYEKAIAHEWAHLRWGVFDEYPLNPEERYYFTSTGDIEGSRCVSDIQGKLVNSVGRECQILNGLGLIDWDCHFEEDLSQQNYFGSMMYKQFLTNVDMFCDEQDVTHNKEAPVMQNKMCDSKSVWQVMNEHGDFCSGNNPANDDNEFSTVPNFRIVRQLTKRTVLVLDISNSMNNEDKLTRLRQAASNYILNNVGEGEQLGIVTFNTYASVTSQLKTVTDMSVRNELLSSLPNEALQETSIAAGLLKGIEVLEEGGKSASGGNLLLITDGKEIVSPWLEDNKQTIYDSGVIVDTIAISQEADSKIEALATNTGGISFYYSVNTESNALNEALTAISERDRSDLDQGVLLFSNSLEIPSNGNYLESVEIDSTVGMDTEFTFDYINNLVDVKLNAPDGSIIDNSSSSYKIDREFEAIRIAIPGEATVGKWSFEITNPSISKVPCTILVSSRARSGEQYPVIATAEWKVNEVTPPEENTALYVAVSKGYTPVLNSFVVAEIERPSGSKVEIVLKDEGAGADMKKNDGIYSSYFTEFNSNSSERYSTKVIVQSSDDTIIIPGTKIGVGASYDMVGSLSDKDVEKVENLQRVLSPNTFQCNGQYCEAANMDLYGPARIHNLVVTRIDYNIPSVTIEFTAPGDDLDQGKASYYIIKRGSEFDELYGNFNNATKVVSSEILSTLGSSDINQPKSSGEREIFEIKVPKMGNLSYYFAVVAVDDVGKIAMMSNVVSASMKYSINSQTSRPTIMTQEGIRETTSSISIYPPVISPNKGIPLYIIYILIFSIIFVILVILIIALLCYYKKKKKSKFDQDSSFLSVVVGNEAAENHYIGNENWQLQATTTIQVDENQQSQNVANSENAIANTNMVNDPDKADDISTSKALSNENSDNSKSTNEKPLNATNEKLETENSEHPEKLEQSEQLKKSKKDFNSLNVADFMSPSTPKPYRMVTGSKPASHFAANRNFAHGSSQSDLDQC